MYSRQNKRNTTEQVPEKKPQELEQKVNKAFIVFNSLLWSLNLECMCFCYLPQHKTIHFFPPINFQGGNNTDTTTTNDTTTDTGNSSINAIAMLYTYTLPNF